MAMMKATTQPILQRSDEGRNKQRPQKYKWRLAVPRSGARPSSTQPGCSSRSSSGLAAQCWAIFCRTPYNRHNSLGFSNERYSISTSLIIQTVSFPCYGRHLIFGVRRSAFCKIIANNLRDVRTVQGHGISLPENSKLW